MGKKSKKEELRAAALSQRAMDDARALGRKIGEEGKRLRKLAEKEGRRPKEERDASFEKAHQKAVADELEATKDAEFDDENDRYLSPPNDLNQQNFEPLDPSGDGESPCAGVPSVASMAAQHIMERKWGTPKTSGDDDDDEDIVTISQERAQKLQDEFLDEEDQARVKRIEEMEGGVPLKAKEIVWSKTYRIPSGGVAAEVAGNFQKWQEAQRLIGKAGVVCSGSSLWDLAVNNTKPKEMVALEKQHAKLGDKLHKFHRRRSAKVTKLQEELDAMETQLFIDLFSDGDCSATKMAKLISKHIDRVKKIEQKAKSAWK